MLPEPVRWSRGLRLRRSRPARGCRASRRSAVGRLGRGPGRAPAPQWPAPDPGTAPAARQQTFDSLGTPLRDVTFVVVDLETTGQAPGASAITEFGAVKVRGGEVLGEFQTLVNPGVPIPPMITVLTGITTAMVLPAPRIESVFPGFLEFAGFDRGSVLVAHNARFDVSFLKAAAADLGFPWPAPTVVDTLALCL